MHTNPPTHPYDEPNPMMQPEASTSQLPTNPPPTQSQGWNRTEPPRTQFAYPSRDRNLPFPNIQTSPRRDQTRQSLAPDLMNVHFETDNDHLEEPDSNDSDSESSASSSSYESKAPRRMKSAVPVFGTTRTVYDMPIRGSRDVPKTFRGHHSEVEYFIAHYDRLLVKFHVNDPRDQCECIIDYCSTDVQGFIRASEYFHKQNWPKLRKEILRCYDADRATSRYKPSDIATYTLKTQKRPFHSLSQWKKYFIKYKTMAGMLLQQGHLTKLNYDVYFWLGIHPDLRPILEQRILQLNPRRKSGRQLTVKEISDAAEWYFRRDRAEAMVINAADYGIDLDSDTSDDESDGHESEDSDDSDYEVYRRKHRAKLRKRKEKEKEKKKKKPSSTSGVSPTRTTLKTTGTAEEVSTLIRQLNKMSITDPEYPPVYYKVLALDTTGIAAKCRGAKPPPVMDAGRRDTELVNVLVSRTLLRKEVIRIDEDTRKLRMKDGTYIRRTQGETLVQAAARLSSPRPITDRNHGMNVPALTPPSLTGNWIAKPSQYDSGDEDEPLDAHWYAAASNSDSDPSLEDGEVYLAVPRAQEQPVAEDLQVNAAERTVPSTRAARKEVFDGVQLPRRDKTREGASNAPARVVEIKDRPKRQSNDVPPPAAKDLLPPLTPVDVRTPRDVDVDMEIDSPEVKQDKLDRKSKSSSQNRQSKAPTDATRAKDLQEETQDSKAGGRRSEIQNSVHIPAIIDRILDLTIPMTVREAFVASKDIRTGILDTIRLKNVKAVLLGKGSDNPIVASWNWPRSEGVLIKIDVTTGGRTISAIVDTGSQLDVVRTDIAALKIQRPIDMSRIMSMNDANGGKGQLQGFIGDVEFNCGGVLTFTDLWMSQQAPFELLLGRPWQRGNLVSIDERDEGTYLVFKDRETRKPRYELLAIPYQQCGESIAQTSTYTEDKEEPQQKQTLSLILGLGNPDYNQTTLTLETTPIMTNLPPKPAEPAPGELGPEDYRPHEPNTERRMAAVAQGLLASPQTVFKGSEQRPGGQELHHANLLNVRMLIHDPHTGLPAERTGHAEVRLFTAPNDNTALVKYGPLRRREADDKKASDKRTETLGAWRRHILPLPRTSLSRLAEAAAAVKATENPAVERNIAPMDTDAAPAPQPVGTGRAHTLRFLLHPVDQPPTCDTSAMVRLGNAADNGDNVLVVDGGPRVDTPHLPLCLLNSPPALKPIAEEAMDVVNDGGEEMEGVEETTTPRLDPTTAPAVTMPAKGAPAPPPHGALVFGAFVSPAPASPAFSTAANAGSPTPDVFSDEEDIKSPEIPPARPPTAVAGPREQVEANTAGLAALDLETPRPATLALGVPRLGNVRGRPAPPVESNAPATFPAVTCAKREPSPIDFDDAELVSTSSSEEGEIKDHAPGVPPPSRAARIAIPELGNGKRGPVVTRERFSSSPSFESEPRSPRVITDVEESEEGVPLRLRKFCVQPRTRPDDPPVRAGPTSWVHVSAARSTLTRKDVQRAMGEMSSSDEGSIPALESPSDSEEESNDSGSYDSESVRNDPLVSDHGSSQTAPRTISTSDTILPAGTLVRDFGYLFDRITIAPPDPWHAPGAIHPCRPRTQPNQQAMTTHRNPIDLEGRARYFQDKLRKDVGVAPLTQFTHAALCKVAVPVHGDCFRLSERWATPRTPLGSEFRVFSEWARAKGDVFMAGIGLQVSRRPGFVAVLTILKICLLAFLRRAFLLLQHYGCDLDDAILHDAANLPLPFLNGDQNSQLRMVTHALAVSGRGVLAKLASDFMGLRFREPHLISFLNYSGMLEPTGPDAEQFEARAMIAASALNITQARSDLGRPLLHINEPFQLTRRNGRDRPVQNQTGAAARDAANTHLAAQHTTSARPVSPRPTSIPAPRLYHPHGRGQVRNSVPIPRPILPRIPMPPKPSSSTGLASRKLRMVYRRASTLTPSLYIPSPLALSVFNAEDLSTL
ncbi:hypothetical protein C8R47DRAFT_1258610 [Mycena vitilis]|nr:hypothetical protein C8R47DRAFT_1258610 [Mycena vitilis]